MPRFRPDFSVDLIKQLIFLGKMQALGGSRAPEDRRTSRSKALAVTAFKAQCGSDKSLAIHHHTTNPAAATRVSSLTILPVKSGLQSPLSSSRNFLMKLWVGQEAASPKAQMVLPSI